MDCQIKGKNIEPVRKYECIYNQKHKDYKNSLYKSLLWEQFGVGIGIEGQFMFLSVAIRDVTIVNLPRFLFSIFIRF